MDTLLLVGGREKEGNIISQLVRLRELTQPRAGRVNAQQRTAEEHSGAHDIFSVSDLLAFDILQRQRQNSTTREEYQRHEGCSSLSRGGSSQ